MTSGYKVAGTDLDSIFAPTHPGWGQAGSVGYRVLGADLSTRYAILSAGSAAAATGYKSAGVDLNSFFAALGTTGVQVATQPSNVSGSAAAGTPSGTVTSGAATCAFTKGGGSYTYTWVCSGCTANSPNSPTTTFSAVVNAGSTDNATAFCQGSDGVTSVNTNTIAVTLQNTSPAFTANNTMVAGSLTGFVGFVTSTLAPPGCGSMSPSRDVHSEIISECGKQGANFEYWLDSGVSLGQSYFTTFQIDAADIGFVQLASSAASYSFDGTYSKWIWSSGVPTLTSGNSYGIATV